MDIAAWVMGAGCQDQGCAPQSDTPFPNIPLGPRSWFWPWGEEEGSLKAKEAGTKEAASLRRSRPAHTPGHVASPPPSPVVAIDPEQQGFWVTARQDQREFWSQTHLEHLKFMAKLKQDQLEFRATLGLAGPLLPPAPLAHQSTRGQQGRRGVGTEQLSLPPHTHDTRRHPQPSDHTSPHPQSYTPLQEPTDRPPSLHGPRQRGGVTDRLHLH